MEEGKGPGWERLWLAAGSLALCMIVLLVGSVAIIARHAGGDTTRIPLFALIGAFAVTVALLEWARQGKGPLPLIASRFPRQLEGAFRRRPVVSGLSFALAFVGLVQVARLSCFMADPALRWGSAYPPVEFGVSHMCISAYVLAGDLSRKGAENVYAEEYYPAFDRDGPTGGPRPPSAVENLDAHLRDAFEYPPPFLLLPRAALLLTNDFLVIRTAWFIIQILLFFALALALASFIGGSRGLVAGLLLPGLLSSFPFMFNFQFGQFHLAAIMLAVGGMLAFARGWNWTGGVLLGAAVVTKVFPALFLLYFAFQRRGRPIFWTCVFVAVYLLVGLMVLGPGPYEAFMRYQVPRLLSGEAFSFNLTNDLTLATNASVWSIPFKLDRLGIPGMSAQLAVGLLWIYTAVIVGTTYLAARRNHPVELQPLIWMGLLTLASLRSPDAPNVYIGTSALWALTFLALETRGRAWPVLLFVIVWIFVNVVPPPPDPRATIVLWMVVQFVIMATGFYLVLRRTNSGTPALQHS